jgi:hypothetical protein
MSVVLPEVGFAGAGAWLWFAFADGAAVDFDDGAGCPVGEDLEDLDGVGLRAVGVAAGAEVAVGPGGDVLLAGHVEVDDERSGGGEVGVEAGEEVVAGGGDAGS